METPKVLPDINVDSIKKICQEYIAYISSDDYHEDNDFDHYIFETTMEAVYGKDVWKFINSKLK